MSKVYSFRLSEDNPREAQVIKIIETKVSEGYRLRFIVVDSLIISHLPNQQEKFLNEFVNKLSEIIDRSSNEKGKLENRKALTQKFIQGIKQSVSNGTKAE